MTPKDPVPTGPVLPPDIGISKTGMHNGAKAFSDEAENLTKDVNAQTKALDSLGNFAGDDDLGRQFNQGYGQAVLNAIGYANALATTYPEIARRIRQISDNLEIADWANIAALPKVPQTGPSYNKKNATFEV